MAVLLRDSCAGRNAFILVAAIWLAFSAWPAAAQAEAERRVALVIGNSAYRKVERLDNPLRDARDVAAALRKTGFELVGGGAQLDLDKRGMEQAIRSFGRSLERGAVGLFYYSGHGLEVDGHNYLVPVDADPKESADVDFELVDVGLLLKQVRNANNRLSMIVLDACRINPFGGRGLRAVGTGLAEIKDRPSGTIISYATAPGKVAADGPPGANSPYTAAFLDAVRRPGLDVLEVFNEVSVSVENETKGEQQPWTGMTAIRGQFFFVPPASTATAAPPPPPGPASSEAAEMMLWSSVKDSRDPAKIQAYLDQFPQGTFAGLAKVMIGELKRNQMAALAARPEAPAAAAPSAAAPAEAAPAAPEPAPGKRPPQTASLPPAAALPLPLPVPKPAAPVAAAPAPAAKPETPASLTLARPPSQVGQRAPVQSPDVDLYLKEMRDNIFGNLVYPDAARERGLAGAAKYELVVDRDGQLLDVRLARSSGSDILDRAGRQAVELSAPFEPVPAEVSGDKIGLLLTLYIGPEAPERSVELVLSDVEHGKPAVRGNPPPLPAEETAPQQKAEAAAPIPESAISAEEARRKGVEAAKSKDYGEAMRWFRKAADEGNAVAQNDVGFLYQNGWGVPQDYAEAMRWFRKAADQGNAHAQNNVGFLYYNGWGVPQDYAEAMRWQRNAADQGYAAAQVNVGAFYQNAWGVPKDYAEAMRWYRRASDQGYAQAQSNIGLLYQKGWGVSQDYAEAMRWYRKAADQGNTYGQNYIGLLYQNGWGVSPDFAEAIRWFRMAADHGNTWAQNNIGYLYQKGLGVPQDYAQARNWYALAAAHGNQTAKENLRHLPDK